MSEKEEKVRDQVRQILEKLKPEERAPVLREVQAEFNAAEKRKEQELSTAKRRKRELEKELALVQKQLSRNRTYLDRENAKLDASYTEFDRVLQEKDENGKSVLELFEETGLANYLLQHKDLQSTIESFFRNRDVFVNGRLPESKQGAVLRELDTVVEHWLRANDFDRDDTLLKAISAIGFKRNDDSNQLTKIVGYLVAREALLRKATEQLQQKYLTGPEIAAVAKETIDAFHESYASHLTGDVKKARDEVWAMPSGLVKQMHAALDKSDAKDFDGLKSRVVDIISSEYPKGVEPDGEHRAKIFTRLFDLTLESLGPEQSERETLGYLISERIFDEYFIKAVAKLDEEHEVEDNGDDLDLDLNDHLSNSELWSDEQLTITGMKLWERTYKLNGGDKSAINASYVVAKNWGEAARARGVTVNENREGAVQVVVGFTAKWAVHAFQRITTTHTYAAALMCSDASKDVLQDLEMQWHAFMVCLPNGLLKYTDNESGIENEYNRILVASFDNSASMVLLNQTGSKSNHRLVVQVSDNIAKLLDVGDVDLVHTTGEDELGEGTRSKVQRIVILAKRLIAGLLLALQNQNNFKSKSYPARDGKKQREPGSEPAHRVVFVGSPLKIDCRPSVADYIKNGSPKRKGAPPAVQLLVRGHHKRQVIGVGRTLRKVVWISPYWRGPDDAPILTRPKQVNG